MALLEIRNLTKAFGGLTAIHDLSFEVGDGEIVSVIGPNGAGKTTLFNLITGLTRPDSGEILLDGTDVVGLRPNQIVARGIARTFQNVRLFPLMTVRENVLVGMHTRTKSGPVRAILRTPGFRREEREAREKADETLAFFGDRLKGFRLDQPALVLSYANRRRLEMARAMASDPKILLLDEPTAGMNPRETQELTGLVAKLRDDQGFTICLIEHDMRLVRTISDRVIVLDYGEKIAEGSYQEVATNDRVIEAYLGTKVTGTTA